MEENYLAGDKERNAISISNVLPDKDQYYAGAQSFYTLIVKGDNQRFDKVDRYIPLDLVDDITISSSSDITQYPLINGDIIMDHKYDQPKTITISGKFSTLGKFNQTFKDSSASTRLANIESYFESVKKMGKTLELICGNNGAETFKTHNNLILQSYSFGRKYNMMSFNFTLKEVYMFEGEEITINEYEGDPDLPTCTSFTSLSFTEDIMDIEDITSDIIKVLQKNGLIDDSFYEMFVEDVMEAVGQVFKVSVIAAIVSSVLILTPVAISAAVAAAATAIGVTAATVSATGVGLVVVGVVILAAAAIWGIYKLFNTAINNIKRAKLINQFKSYGNDSQDLAECQRFCNLISKVKDNYENLVSDKNIQFYGFSSNLAKQRAYLNIDDSTYRFDFERSTNENSCYIWQINVYNITKDKDVVINGNGKMVGCQGVLDLEWGDRLFHTTNAIGVYLVNGGLAYNDLDEESLKSNLENEWRMKASGYLGYAEEYMENNLDNPPTDELYGRFKKDGVYADLTKFKLIVSNADMSSLKDNLNSVIIDSIKKEADS